ncbi:hypothetical protein SSAG_05147 [Streptomyces sp. Mg1]|nr:hypothetical protein SSAG_05147 [Streptomyces sp. Mg1]
MFLPEAAGRFLCRGGVRRGLRGGGVRAGGFRRGSHRALPKLGRSGEAVDGAW